MANHVPGAGSTVSGKSYSDPNVASKERWVFGVLSFLEQEENTLPKIAKRTDTIGISVDMSKLVATVNLLLNVTATVESDKIIYTASHYLTGSAFTSGTGGDSVAPNLTQAAHEAVMVLKTLEMDVTKNLTNPQVTVVKTCTHRLGPSGATNATFTATLEFPIEVINLPGGSVIQAKNYLT